MTPKHSSTPEHPPAAATPTAAPQGPPSATGPAPVWGLLLAAGSGSRLGNRPKALLPHHGRPLVEHAIQTLRDGGCAGVVVVLGAAADQVREQADLTGSLAVDNPDWPSGMGSSLRVGLAALPSEAAAAVVTLVDMPGVGASAVARLAAAFREGADLAAAAYHGDRGHPVLFAARWWPGVAESARGDAGARGFLRAHAAELRLVECADVADPYDIDTPGDLHRLA